MQGEKGQRGLNSQFLGPTRAKIMFRCLSTWISRIPYLRHCRRMSVTSCRALFREMEKHRCSVTGFTRKSRASQLWCVTMLR